ncbi:MBL fold metallo-hydrolase [Salidesulfovibrio brasiliensis]
MKCTFLGVGEAFDEELPNTSLLVFDGSGSVMLDCGFTAAPQLWRCMPHPVRLDAVWISHFHGDHWFGLPWLLARMHEEGRDKPLTVAGQREVGHRVKALAETAYPGLLDKLNFRLVFRELESGESAELGGFSVRCAVGEHSLRNQAIRLDSSHGSVFYSGDGRPTSATTELARGCDLLVQEAYALHGQTIGHGTVEAALEMARIAEPKALALVHLGRRVARRDSRAINIKLAESGFRAFVPEPGDVWDVASAAKGE